MPFSTTSPRRRLALGATVVGATAVLVLLPAAGASAHVRVTPSSTASGGYSELTFRVPNEKDAASTTKIVVTLPQTDPFSYVAVKPVPGWTATVTEDPLPTPVDRDGTTLTKAPHLVTWTATGDAAIQPGQYQTFSINAGPLPKPGQLELPTDQTYSDGSVVTWADHQAAGAAEPENPAPSFVVTAAAAGGGDDDDTTPVATVSASSTDTSDPVARWLSGAALAVAVVGAGGALALGRRRGTTAGPAA